MTPLEYAVYRLLCDLSSLLFLQLVAVATLVALSCLDSWVAIALASLVAGGGAVVLRCTRPWVVLNTILLPAGACLFILSEGESQSFSLIFTISLTLYLSIYLPTFWTRVPFYRTQPWVAMEVARAVRPEYAQGPILELGCGFGGFMSQLTRALPEATIDGIEISPLPSMIAKLRFWRNRKTRALWKSFWLQPFAGYSVIYAFLSPEPMRRLWEKCREEMRPGTILISYQFAIPGVAPESQIQGPPLEGSQQEQVLYIYRI